MSSLPKLRDSLGSFIDHSPFRWVVLSLAVATVIGTASYSYREIDSELTAVALSRREAVAQLMAAMLKEKFGRITDVVSSLATRPGFKKSVTAGQWDKAIELQLGVLSDMPYIERIFLSDAAGTLKADAPALPGVRGLNFESREWYIGVSRNWQPYVSPIYTRAATPQLNVIAVTVPVKNSTGHVVGILGMQIRIENLLEWIYEINAGVDAFTYIVDSKGQIAFHSKHRNLEKITNLSTSPIVQKLLGGEQGVEIGFDIEEQEESIIAYADVPGSGWGVVVQQPIRSTMALTAKDRLLRQLLAGYSLILLLGIMTAILTLRIASARQNAENDRRMKADLERRVSERTAELESANRELEAFSYSVSHDLRAPLRAIDGFSQAIIEDYSGSLDDQGKSYLNRVRAATQRMGLLIDDMLALSRVTRVEMRLEKIDLSALAANVFAELQKSEAERKVEWLIEPGLTGAGDERLLRMALVNLLGNAWKFTSLREQPRIEFGSTLNADGSTEFFVRDNGTGFDMVYADKLFGVFQRLHSAAEFPGTGVGLAIVKRIIQRHGGQVRGAGMPDQGATFYFTLPG